MVTFRLTKDKDNYPALAFKVNIPIEGQAEYMKVDTSLAVRVIQNVDEFPRYPSELMRNPYAAPAVTTSVVNASTVNTSASSGAGSSNGSGASSSSASANASSSSGSGANTAGGGNDVNMADASNAGAGGQSEAGSGVSQLPMGESFFGTRCFLTRVNSNPNSCVDSLK